MSNCQNCSNKCFEHTSGKCVTYNGESFPDVNVIQNNNVESVIEGLAKATSDLKSFVEECSACNGASNEKIAEADFSYVSSENLQSFPDHRLACLLKIRDFRAFKIVNFNSSIHIVYV